MQSRSAAAPPRAREAPWLPAGAPRRRRRGPREGALRRRGRGGRRGGQSPPVSRVPDKPLPSATPAPPQVLADSRSRRLTLGLLSPRFRVRVPAPPPPSFGL